MLFYVSGKRRGYPPVALLLLISPLLAVSYVIGRVS
jgi:hypothetical protein